MTKITESLFAHINNDPFLTGSYQLQGQYFKNTVGFLRLFLDTKKAKGETASPEVRTLVRACARLAEEEDGIQPLYNVFTTPKTLRDKALAWFDVINSIPPFSKQIALLPGGWRNMNGGHALIYQFHRDGEDLIFTIHNSGAGINYHAKRSSVDKELYSPTLSYRIPKKSLKDEFLVFMLQDLLKALLPHLREDRHDVDEKIIYEVALGKLHLINAEIVAPDEQDYQYFTAGQLSGTCAQRSIHQMLKSRFSSRDEYRRFIFEFKAFSLEEYLKQLRQEQTLSQQHLHPQIKKAIRHLLRLLLLEKQNAPEPLFAPSIQAKYFEKYHQYLIELRSLSLPPTPTENQTATRIIRPHDFKINKTFNLRFSTPVIKEVSSLSHDVKRRFAIHKPDLSTVSDLIAEMTFLIERAKVLSTHKRNHQIILELEHFFLQLPLPNDKEAPLLDFYRNHGINEHFEVFFGKIFELQQYYFKSFNSFFGQDVLLPRMLAFKLSNFAVCAHLSRHMGLFPNSDYICYIERSVQKLLEESKKAVFLNQREPILDERLLHLRRLYVRITDSNEVIAPERNELQHLHATQKRLLATLKNFLEEEENFSSFSFVNKQEEVLLSLYNTIIESFPELKAQLEHEFSQQYRDPNIQYIEDISNLQCEAVFLFLKDKLNAWLFKESCYEPIRQKFAQLIALEKALLGYPHVNDKKNKLDSIHCFTVISIIRLKAPIRYLNDSFKVFSNLWDAIYPLPLNEVRNCFSYDLPTIAAYKLSFADQSLKSSSIQLKQSTHHRDNKSFVTPEDLTERELYHLRQHPESQIWLTLEYFIKHPEKLASIHMQTYCEANLFQPGLLKSILESESSLPFFELFHQFVHEGLAHSQKSGYFTQHTIFYLYLNYLVMHYAFELNAAQFAPRMDAFLTMINGWISTHQPPTEKAQLHGLRFLTLNARFKAPTEWDDTHIADALTSFFICKTEAQIHALQSLDHRYRCHQIETRFTEMMQTRDLESLPLTTVLKQLSAFGLVPDSTNWDFEPKINAPFVELYSRDGQCYQLHLEHGTIFVNQLCIGPIPPHLNLHPVIKQFDLQDVQRGYQNATQTQWVIEQNALKLRFTASSNNEQYHVEQWMQTDTPVPGWFELIAHSKAQQEILNLPPKSLLKGEWPSSLQQKETFVWADTKRKNHLIITNAENKVIYQAFKKRDGWHIIKQASSFEVIHDGKRLVHPFEQIEAMRFIIANRDEAGQLYCELPRYQLHFHKASINAPFQWQWQDKTYYMDETLSPHPILPMVTFAEKTLCMIPIQPLIAVDKRHAVNEYYQLALDINHSIPEAFVDETDDEDKPLFEHPKLWQFEGTEHVMVLKMKQGEPYPETPAQALYLAYLYLGFHQEKKALNLLNLCHTRLGGLEGNEEEKTYLYWLCKHTPFQRPNNKIDEGAVKRTPKTITCQLKALHLWLTRNKADDGTQTSALEFDTTTPNGYYQKKIHQSKEAFFAFELNAMISFAYSTYQAMRRDLPVRYQLSESESRTLLNHCLDTLPTSEEAQKEAVGALGYDWLRFNLLTLQLESDRLLAKKEQCGSLSLYEQKRLNDIQYYLDNSDGAYRIASKVTQKFVSFGPFVVHSINTAVLEKVFNQSVHFNDGDANLSQAMTKLNFEMTLEEFKAHFEHYWFIATNQSVHTPKLKTFCTAFLRWKERSRSTNQRANLCDLLYRAIDAVEKNPASFKRPFDSFYAFCDFLKSLQPTPLSIYQLEDHNEELLCDLRTIQRTLPNFVTPIPISLPDARVELIAQLALFSTDEAAEYIERANQWQALEERFHLVGYESDFEPSPAQEALFGKQKNELLHELQRFATTHLSQHDSLEKIEQQLTTRMHQLELLQNDLVQRLLELANRVPKEEVQRLNWQISRLAKKQKKLDMDDLISLYVHNDYHQYEAKTALSRADIAQLHELMALFLKQGLLMQQIARTLKLVEPLRLKKLEDYTASDFFKVAQTLYARNEYDAVGEPITTVFQYQENLLLRPNQRLGIEDLLTFGEHGRFKEIVIKMVMGAGKSKVFTPLLMKQKATGYNLVIVEVPKALLRTNKTDLESLSNAYFSQKAVLFQFSRDSDSSVQALKRIHRLFSECMVEQNYLITTGDSMQSLELKYLELLASKPSYEIEEEEELEEEEEIEEIFESEELKSQVQQWRQQVYWAEKIVQFIRHRGDALIDEVHEGLALKNRLNYTLGESSALPTFISEEIIALYRFFKYVPLTGVVSSNTPLLTLQALTKAHKPLNDTVELKQCMQPLVHALLNHEHSPLIKLFKRHHKSLTDAESASVKTYLLSESPTIPEYIMALDEHLQDVLALYKEQVSHLLPFTLSRNANEHFGPSKNPHKSASLQAIAIPYRANNAPNEQSQFGNELETINYTIQALLINGVSQALFKVYLEYLLNKAQKELQNNPLSSIDETETGLLYDVLSDGHRLSLLDLNDDKAIELLHQNVYEKQELLYDILTTQVLPNIRVHSEVLSSNAINHVELYKTVQGFSGTPWNASTFHQRLTYDPKLGQGSDGFILTALKEKKTRVHCVDFSDAKVIIPKLFNAYQDSQPLRAIIDVAAAFKGIPNEAVACQIAQWIKDHPNDFKNPTPIQYILYFNTQDELSALPVHDEERLNIITLDTTAPDVITERLACSPAAYFTYYDQAHTLGTDIRQDRNAKAMILCDTNTTISPFLQGALRMRDLLEGQQSVDVVVPNEMQDRLDLAALTEYMSEKEQARLKHDNFIAAQHKMTNCIRADLLNRIIESTESAEEKAQWFTHFRTHFIETMVERLFLRFGVPSTLQHTQDILNHFKDVLINQWKANLEQASIFLSFEEETCMRSQLNTIIEQACQPGVCDVLQKSIQPNEDLQVELQTQIELLEERQREQYDPNQKPVSAYAWQNTSPLDDLSMLETRTLSQISASQHIAYIPNFSEAIAATRNFYKVHKDQNSFLTQTMYPVHGIYFERKSDNTLQCLLLAPCELNEAKQYIESNPHKTHWVSTTKHTCLAGSMPENIKMDQAYRLLIEQIRFFAGDLHLLTMRDTPLQWLEENAQEKLDFFKTYLAPGREFHPSHLEILTQSISARSSMLKQIIEHPEKDWTTFKWQAHYPDISEVDAQEMHAVARAFFQLNGSWWNKTITPESLTYTHNLPLEVTAHLKQHHLKRQSNLYLQKLGRLIQTLVDQDSDHTLLNEQDIDQLVQAIQTNDASSAIALIEQIPNAKLLPTDEAALAEFYQQASPFKDKQFVDPTPNALLPFIFIHCKTLTLSQYQTLVRLGKKEPLLIQACLNETHNPFIENSFSLFIDTLPQNELEANEATGHTISMLMNHPLLTEAHLQQISQNPLLTTDNIETCLSSPSLEHKMNPQTCCHIAEHRHLTPEHACALFAKPAVEQSVQITLLQRFMHQPGFLQALFKNHTSLMRFNALLQDEATQSKALLCLEHRLNDASLSSEIIDTIVKHLTLPANVLETIVLHPNVTSETLKSIQTMDRQEIKALKAHIHYRQQLQRFFESLSTLQTFIVANGNQDRNTIEQKAQKAALELHADLQNVLKPYLENQRGLIQPKHIVKFKAQCTTILADKKRLDTIQQHPQLWYRIHPIIRSMLGILSAITILPGLIVHAASTNGFRHVFFKTPLSQGAQCMQTINQSLNQLDEDDHRVRVT